MRLFYPDMYKKNIFDINYDKLKKIGIKLLIFDLDNTIALIDQNLISKDTVNLFKKLNDDFKIVIISNNSSKERVKTYASQLNCDFVYFAMKPLLFGFRRIKNKYNIKQSNMAMIGDQLVTDIFAGHRFKSFTILVDPIGEKDLKITLLNRKIERHIMNKMKDIFKKGDYYE